MKTTKILTLIFGIYFFLHSGPPAASQVQSKNGEIWFENYYDGGEFTDYLDVEMNALGNYRWDDDLERTLSHTGPSNFAVPEGGTSTRWSVSAVWDDCDEDLPCKIAADIYEVNLDNGAKKFYLDIRSTEVMTEPEATVHDIIIYKDEDGKYRWDHTFNQAYDGKEIEDDSTYTYWALLPGIDLETSGFDQSVTTPTNFAMSFHSVGGGVCCAKAYLEQPGRRG